MAEVAVKRRTVRREAERARTSPVSGERVGHRMPHLSKGTKGQQVGSRGDGERWGSDRGTRGSLNEQIALVLIRLQEDMQSVLQRLHKLEALTASQAKLSLQTSNQPSSQRPSWRPFEMSPGALALLFYGLLLLSGWFICIIKEGEEN